MLDKLTSKKNLPIIGTIIAGIIIVFSLFILQIGVEDNGSLEPRLEQMGLYDVSQASGSGYYSQHFGVANKSLSINPSYFIYTVCKQFFGVDTIMNSMIPAAVYAVIYIFGIYLLLKALMSDIKWSNILVTILLPVILCDSAYTAYFNTPYAYATVIAFLPLFVYSVVIMAKNAKIYPFILAAVSGTFVFGVHNVCAASGIIFGIYFLTFIFRKKEVASKILCVVCAVLILASSVFQLTEFSVQAMYDSVFYGALYENEGDAANIGVSEYRELAGVPSFDDKAQAAISSGELDNKLSYANIMMFYFKNPGQMLKNMKIAANNGTAIKTAYLGSFTPSSGKNAGEVSKFFSLYSTLKSKFVPNNIVFMVVALIFVIYFSLIYRKKYSKTLCSKVCAELSAFFALGCLITIPVVVVLFGVTQIVFNMFIFNLLFDSALAFAVAGGTKLLWVRRQVLKEKYGVNQ